MKPRYYCQAQIDQNLPTQEITLQDGNITVKNPNLRYVGSFAHNREKTANGRMPFRLTRWLEEINADNAPDEAMRILEQALDLWFAAITQLQVYFFVPWQRVQP